MRRKVLIVLSTIWICFIFFNSFQTGAESGAISGSFVNWIYNTLLSLKIEVDPSVLSIIIRKGAHIFEFFVLGILMTLIFLEFKLQDKYQLLITFLFQYLFLLLIK